MRRKDLVRPSCTLMHEDDQCKRIPRVSFSAFVGSLECRTAMAPIRVYTSTSRDSYSWALYREEKAVAWRRCGLDYFCAHSVSRQLAEAEIPEEYRKQGGNPLRAAYYYAVAHLTPLWNEHVEFCEEVVKRYEQWVRGEEHAHQVDPPGWVYLAGTDRPDYPVKIGFTQGKEPDSRISSLQIGCPYKLKVLDSFKGRYSDERAAHEALSDHRLSGEWFEDCENVRDVFAQIAEARSRDFQPGAVWPPLVQIDPWDGPWP